MTFLGTNVVFKTTSVDWPLLNPADITHPLFYTQIFTLKNLIGIEHLKKIIIK